MRIIRSLPIQLSALLVMAGLVKVTGQPASNTFLASRELMNIKRTLQDTSHKSFQGTYVIAYNDGTSNTLHYHYRVCGNRMHVVSDDSSEFIQSGLYYLLLKHNRQRATLSPPVDVFKYLLQVDIMGASFNKSYVSGMAVADTGGYKKLSYLFKPESPYRQYDIIYDKTSYLIQAIQYSFNTTGAVAAPAGSKMPFTVTISFGNYRVGGFTDSAFLTDSYFIWSKGKAGMVAPYTSYQLINTLNR
ncbi:hypothetical protein [Niastella populi]|uniref:Uncharacterized protein n=1 Tax=Niastella populi TaxID=550983 RepID=A0A1V9GD99_9BACT|nr:hypothetical protein [Niastella populi]OQP68406.1 hypothetical protein A4R26_00945 [Niastella populi]